MRFFSSNRAKSTCACRTRNGKSGSCKGCITKTIEINQSPFIQGHSKTLYTNNYDSNQKSDLEVEEIKYDVAEKIDKLDVLINDMSTIRREIEELKREMEGSAELVQNFATKSGEMEEQLSKIDVDDDQIHLIKYHVNKLKKETEEKSQWNRSNTAEILGIPYTKGENLYKVLAIILEKIQLHLNQEHVTCVVREPPTKEKKETSVIVYFNNHHIKNAFVAAVHEIKNITAKDLELDSDNNIYVF